MFLSRLLVFNLAPLMLTECEFTMGTFKLGLREGKKNCE